MRIGALTKTPHPSSKEMLNGGVDDDEFNKSEKLWSVMSSTSVNVLLTGHSSVFPVVAVVVAGVAVVLPIVEC